MSKLWIVYLDSKNREGTNTVAQAPGLHKPSTVGTGVWVLGTRFLATYRTSAWISTECESSGVWHHVSLIRCPIEIEVERLIQYSIALNQSDKKRAIICFKMGKLHAEKACRFNALFYVTINEWNKGSDICLWRNVQNILKYIIVEEKEAFDGMVPDLMCAKK